jgi:hypothetical protein
VSVIGEFLDELRAALGGDQARVAVVMAPAAPNTLAPPTVYVVPGGRQSGTFGQVVSDVWRAVAAVTWQPDAAMSAVEDLAAITDALVKAAAATGAGWQRSEYLGKVPGGAGGPDAIVEVHYLLFADR